MFILKRTLFTPNMTTANCHLICKRERNYVKGVHRNNAVVSVKKCTLFLFSVEKYKFDIPK